MKSYIKVMVLTFSVLCFAGCTTVNTTSNSQKEDLVDAYGDIPQEEKHKAGSILETAWNPNDSKKLYETSNYVALVFIESIDGGDNQSISSSERMDPFTYGKMRVQEVYKGKLDIGSMIGYTRFGGIIPYESYLQSLDSETQASIKESEQDEHPKYFELTYLGDISIEVGKTYLVFMDECNFYNVDGLSMYSIIGWEGGLREVQSNHKDGLLVLNNETKEWKPLEEVVQIK